jgi:hypothetical protein
MATAYRAAALCFVAGLVACGGDKSSESGTSSASTSSGTRASTVVQRPSGGPAPGVLQGRWQLVSVVKKKITVDFQLIISDRKYTWKGSDVNGNVVAKGNEVVFFNESLCRLAFPEGVARYKWNVKAEMLHLHLVGKEPCRDRGGVFDDAMYRRLG